jgi:C4-dicarboxylate transporter, DctM subunit
MDPMAIGAYSVVAMLVLMGLGVHIAVSLAGCAICGLLLTSGWKITSSLVANSLYNGVSDYSLALIPLYIIMGSVAGVSGIVEDAMKFANKWFGGVRGSLAMTTVACCAFFAAVCGSSAATSVAIGKVMIPEMKRYGYDNKLATGTVASAGTLGILIPPSLVMVVFGIMTNTPIGHLFVAGIIPGILLAAFFMIGIGVYVHIKPELAPPAQKFSWNERFASIKYLWGVGSIISIIWIGIYGGIFTATEAGGIGAFLAFLFLLVRRSLRDAWNELMEAIPDAVQSTAMIFITMVTATLFSKFLTLAGVMDSLLTYMSSSAWSPVMTIVMIYIVIMIMGCFMVAMAVLMLTAPLATTLLTGIGYDPVWVGIIMILLFELANITPPVGLNIYVVKGIAPDVPMEHIFSGAFLFMVITTLFIILLTVFPVIVTWLPSMMR